MGASQQFRQLFDFLPDIHFFAKDSEGRFVAASSEFCRRYGVANETELIGRTDSDFLPPQLCAHFSADDRCVMSTGEPLRNRLEVWVSENRSFDWFLTTKLPLRDGSGKIIGIMGFVYPYESLDGKRHNWVVGAELERAVAWIRSNIKRAITVAELAQHSGLSVRQLHRKFVDSFGMSAKDFILRSRIQTACAMIARGARSISHIAYDCGFCDQSAFTKQFRRQMGMPPNAYIKQRLDQSHSGDGVINDRESGRRRKLQAGAAS